MSVREPASCLPALQGSILLLSMFIFAWFGLEGFTGDAFDALDDWVNIVLVFTAFAGMALALFGQRRPARRRRPLGTVTTALGGISALIVLIHIIAPPGVAAGSVSVDLDPEFGVWLGLIASAAVAVGGYLAMQEEGASASPASGPPPPAPRRQARPRRAEVRAQRRGRCRVRGCAAARRSRRGFALVAPRADVPRPGTSSEVHRAGSLKIVFDDVGRQRLAGARRDLAVPGADRGRGDSAPRSCGSPARAGSRRSPLARRSPCSDGLARRC